MATAPIAQPLDLAQLTATYRRIRDKRGEIKAAYDAEDEKLKAQLETIEGAMLQHLNQHGVDSVRTEAGTFFRQEEIKPSIADDTSFFTWVKENDAFDALYRRVSERFIREYMDSHKDEHGGALLPPGLNVHREYVVRVRKPS